MSSFEAQILIASGPTSAAIVGVCRLLRERQALVAYKRSESPDAARDIGNIITSFHQPLFRRRRRQH